MINFITQLVQFEYTFLEEHNNVCSRSLARHRGTRTHFHQRGVLRGRFRWIAPLALLLMPLLWLGAGIAPVSAQIIETVAGGGIGDGGLATAASVYGPYGMAVASSGDVYFADSGNNRIRKIAFGTGIVTTIAGNGSVGYNGDNIAATSATLNSPRAVVIDAAGNLYIADSYNGRIRRVAISTGIITTVAGSGTFGTSLDNVPAISTPLSLRDLAIDTSGNLYIVEDSPNRIRKVTGSTGIITTVAGNGITTTGVISIPVDIGDNAPATGATFGQVSGIAVDSSGNLYIADEGYRRVRKVTAATGIITTIAGTGELGYNGDNIPANRAVLTTVSGVAVDSSGNVYIADPYDRRVRKVNTNTGLISTVAGTGQGGYNGDNIAGTNARLSVASAVAVDSSGNLYIADRGASRVRKVTLTTGQISTIAGTGSDGFNGEGTVATNARLKFPSAVATDSTGNLYVVDSLNQRIRRVAATTGLITTVAGTGASGYNGDNIAASSATLNFTNARLNSALVNDGAATAASEKLPPKSSNDRAVSARFDLGRTAGNGGIAIDAAGNLYIADSGNARIRKVTASTGIISTVAGTGVFGYNGDNIAATSATLNAWGVAVDSSGNLYIVDSANHRIRKVTVATGIITTIAGTGAAGYNGDNIAGISATLNFPSAVALDLSGNVYIADTSNSRLRKLTIATGTITTIAGTDTFGYNGDNIAATSAALSFPDGVAVDKSGNVYVADTINNRVRKVMVATGLISTVAGTGSAGYNGDSIAADKSMVDHPAGMAVDASGKLYIADQGNDRIRKVSAVPATNYQGLWWNAPEGSESGWGINFAHQGEAIFATWFTYDATGKALWLSMTANKIGTDFIGTLYQTSGPVFVAMPFDPASVTRTAVGSGTLTFSDTNNARFAYIFNGTSQAKSIVRQVFGPLPTCMFGAQPNLALATNYQDLWWAAPGGIESGWGVNFTHQGDNIFATWFTYDVDGTPLWLSATAAKAGVGVYTGPLYRTTGPAFNAVPFSPASVGRNVVGSLTLTFADGNRGTFATTTYGAVQSKSITRQVFKAPGTVCQ